MAVDARQATTFRVVLNAGQSVLQVEPELPVHHLGEQVVFRGELQVEGALGHLRLVRDAGDAGLAETESDEVVCSDIEEAVASGRHERAVG